MDGKVCVITGATSGIGFHAARRIAGMGARIGLVARNPQKAEAAAREFGGAVDIFRADMASLREVRGVAEEISARYPRIDVLLSNAGVYRLRRRESADGYEETFAVNHLAPFLLINLLLDRMKEAPSRVVVTASDAHQGARLDFDDLMLRRRFGSWRAYSRSKLANVMFTYALARRLEGTGVTANAHHPGFVASNLGSGNGIPVKPFMAMLRPFVLSPADGSRTAVYLASSPEVEGVSGKYFTNSKVEARANREHHSNAFSRNEDAQERLWRESAALVGL